LKNELINRHLLEISSGSEILKRLIKNDLIFEYPDPKDGRAKRVSLTEKGRKEIMMAFTDMHKVSEIIIGNLSEKEVGEALGVFNKLTYFHQHIHESDRTSSLETLHQKYVLESTLN
ncbi:MAG: MarR family transcriptional regulator, partial [Bacteroidales bacterium]|nr:MarR family transcriptional regulator [Bacteroidales bacterium]